MNERLLDRATMLAAFERLAQRLQRRGLVANVYLFGGAAIAIGFDSERRTRDVDARFAPTPDVQREVLGTAEDLGLPRWWLNEQGVSYLPRQDEPATLPTFDHPHLRVMRASDRHLLAMKAAASRRNTADIADLRLLARHLGITDPMDVVRIHDEVFPEEPLAEHKRAVIEEALGTAVRATLDVVAMPRPPATTRSSSPRQRCGRRLKSGASCGRPLGHPGGHRRRP